MSDLSALLGVGLAHLASLDQDDLLVPGEQGGVDRCGQGDDEGRGDGRVLASIRQAENELERQSAGKQTGRGQGNPHSHPTPHPHPTADDHASD